MGVQMSLWLLALVRLAASRHSEIRVFSGGRSIEVVSPGAPSAEARDRVRVSCSRTSEEPSPALASASQARRRVALPSPVRGRGRCANFTIVVGLAGPIDGVIDLPNDLRAPTPSTATPETRPSMSLIFVIALRAGHALPAGMRANSSVPST